jgi:Pyruvate/2-oxoacid:ferredoxin oxidoreductase delta subunit
MTLIQTDRMRLDHYEKKERAQSVTLPVEQRLAGMDTEVNLPLDEEQIVAETGRCMSCGYCFDCEKCWLFCQDQAVEKPMEKGMLYTYKMQNCTGCKKCAEECPCGYIDML